MCTASLAWGVRAERAKAQDTAGPTPASSSSLTTAWTPVGPGSVLTAKYGMVTGRVTALVFDPNDPTGNTVYLGATGAGVWKSTNAAGPLSAVTFAPRTDTLPVFAAASGGGVAPSLSIGAIAVQPAAAGGTGIVLAGTGDPNQATDSFYGEGLLRSADGGLTWTLIVGSRDGVNGNHSFAGLATAGLAWSTTSPSLAVAAMSNSPQSVVVGAANSGSVAGLYYSGDAGVTWHMATLYDGGQVVQQPLLGAQPGNPATAVAWDAARGSFFAAVQFHGYYASTDGVNWTRLTAQPGTGLSTANCPANAGGTGSAGCPLFRAALAVQPGTSDLYAFSVDAANGNHALWQDLCSMGAGGACATKAPVWGTRLDGGLLDAGGTAAAGYALALSAPPAAGGTVLLAGTNDVYRCFLTPAAPSACTWRNTTNASNACAAPAGVAPAQHALAAVGQSSGAPLVMIGNDGGLWRSTDGIAETGAACVAGDASHFDNLNAAIASGGSLAEVVGLAQAPGDANVLLVGLGANGTAASSTALSASGAAWPQLSTGEGGIPLIDPGTPANWFASVGVGINLKLCAAGAACSASDFAGSSTIGSTQVNGDVALLHAPVLLDAQSSGQSTNLVTGTCRVWRGPAADGTQWSAANAISAPLDGGQAPCTAARSLVRSVGVGGPVVGSAKLQNSGSSVIYAGMAGTLDGGGAKAGGHVFVIRAANTADASTAWTDVGLSPVTNVLGGVFNPGGYDVSAVTVDPHDSTGATVYATVMGFGGDTAVPQVYRSTDFGAHWATVSANLPNAPANAVLVDPNDANTVYVATDAGVYATQAIATCPGSSCWSVLGTGLPNAPVVSLAAGASLPTGDGRQGMLRAATYGRGVWQQPLLTAVGTAQAAVTLSKTSLAFAAQQVGTQSAPQTITVTSSGNAPVVFGTPLAAGDFAETDTCAGHTLAVGATCAFSVQFAPFATGSRSGSLTIYANVSGGQAVVALTGTGTAPASVVLTPTALAFAATLVNQAAAAQIVSIANTGGTAAAIMSISTGGDFALAANTCSATLASQTACAVGITFTPTASGTRTGTLTVVDSVGTQTATLTGIGQAPATDTLSPAALSFAQQAVGSASAAQQVTLANAGDQPLLLIGAVVSGDFTVVNGCGAALPAHSTCAVSVAFVPTATGTRTGLLTVSDAFRSQAVALTGIAVAGPGVSLSPAMNGFGAIGVGLVSAAQVVTLTNNGGSPLSLSSVTVSNGFVLVTNGCGSTVAAGAACTMQVAFVPTAAGMTAGTLVLTDNAPSSTQTVTLSGTGVDFTLISSGPPSATVTSGTSATYPMLLGSLTGLSGNVAMACTGAPAHSLCTVSPSLGALGSTTVVTVTVQTGLAQVKLERWPAGGMPWFRDGAAALGCLLPIGLIRRRRWRALGCVAFSALLMSNGCSAGRIIPSETGGAALTPTPAGSYTLMVSATSAGVTHTVPLTLVVQ